MTSLGFFEPWGADMSVFDPRVRDLVNELAEAVSDFREIESEIKAKLIEIEPAQAAGTGEAAVILPVFLTGITNIVPGLRWVYEWVEIRNITGSYEGWSIRSGGKSSEEFGVARNFSEDLLPPPVHGSGWDPDQFPPDSSVPFELQPAPLMRPIPMYLIRPPGLQKVDVSRSQKDPPVDTMTVHPWFDFQNMPAGEC